MKKLTVRGVHAPAPRLTRAGLFLIAATVSVPVASALWLIEWLLL